METGWLEDFICLAEAGSFSKAAALRFVTQPAFSRRIQALESWVGTSLVDRSSFPTRLTEAGVAFRMEAIEILRQVTEVRGILRGQQEATESIVRIAVPHTLSLTFFPGWISRLEKDLHRIYCQLLTMNVHDAAALLVEGDCDLLMCYHHAYRPVNLDPARFEMLVLGEEPVSPYSIRKRDGTARFEFPGTKKSPVPYLAYGKNAYLGQMADLAMSRGPLDVHLEKIFETDMSEALKMRVLEGHGVAFLPESAVSRELKADQICRADESGKRCSVVMEVRLYREKAHGRRRRKKTVDELWEHCSGGMKEPGQGSNDSSA